MSHENNNIPPHADGEMVTGCVCPDHKLCNHGGTVQTPQGVVVDPAQEQKSQSKETDPIEDALDLIEKEMEKSETTDSLTPRQAAFVLEYLKERNATQAAIRAGYSINTAQQIGSENLSKPVIKAAINEQLRARARRSLITADSILADMHRLAQRCMQAEPVMVFDKIKGEWKHLGEDIGEPVYQFDSQGANKALENLARNQKLLTDKTEIGNLDGTNLNAPVIKRVYVATTDQAAQEMKPEDEQ
jgi:phage terminase small subunit